MRVNIEHLSGRVLLSARLDEGRLHGQNELLSKLPVSPLNPLKMTAIIPYTTPFEAHLDYSSNHNWKLKWQPLAAGPKLLQFSSLDHLPSPDPYPHLRVSKCIPIESSIRALVIHLYCLHVLGVLRGPPFCEHPKYSSGKLPPSSIPCTSCTCLLGLLHEGEHLHELRLRRVSGHLLSLDCSCTIFVIRLLVPEILG